MAYLPTSFLDIQYLKNVKLLISNNLKNLKEVLKNVSILKQDIHKMFGKETVSCRIELKPLQD